MPRWLLCFSYLSVFLAGLFEEYTKYLINVILLPTDSTIYAVCYFSIKELKENMVAVKSGPKR